LWSDSFLPPNQYTNFWSFQCFRWLGATFVLWNQPYQTLKSCQSLFNGFHHWHKNLGCTVLETTMLWYHLSKGQMFRSNFSSYAVAYHPWSGLFSPSTSHVCNYQNFLQLCCNCHPQIHYLTASPYCLLCFVFCQLRKSIVQAPHPCQTKNPWLARTIARCLSNSAIVNAAASTPWHCQGSLLMLCTFCHLTP
jgi:hypothetical protein